VLPALFAGLNAISEGTDDMAQFEKLSTFVSKVVKLFLNTCELRHCFGCSTSSLTQVTSFEESVSKSFSAMVLSDGVHTRWPIQSLDTTVKNQMLNAADVGNVKPRDADA
jgi:hypothetical protein